MNNKYETKVNCPNCDTEMVLWQGDSTDTPYGICPNCKVEVTMPGYFRLDKSLMFAKPENVFRFGGMK